jgi:peptidyl-prolyl cis-trans isomerase A (cyclophilin A)
MLRLALFAIAVALVAGAASAAASAPPSLLKPSSLNAKAPAVYAVSFKTTKGTFVVTVHRAWASRGADRFYNLVRGRFFDGVEFFRVVKGFVVQFGISPSPKVSTVWTNAVIKDDPVKASNAIGTITYADAGPNTRATQVFINLGDNAFLDKQGFSPFGKVTTGMAVVKKLYGGYAEKPTSAQDLIIHQGNAYLKQHFPRLDAIVTARLVSATP